MVEVPNKNRARQNRYKKSKHTTLLSSPDDSKSGVRHLPKIPQPMSISRADKDIVEKVTLTQGIANELRADIIDNLKADVSKEVQQYTMDVVKNKVKNEVEPYVLNEVKNHITISLPKIQVSAIGKRTLGMLKDYFDEKFEESNEVMRKNLESIMRKNLDSFKREMQDKFEPKRPPIRPQPKNLTSHRSYPGFK